MEIVATVLVWIVIMIVGNGIYFYMRQARNQASFITSSAPTTIGTWAKDNGYQVRVAQRKTRYLGKNMFGYWGPYVQKVGYGQHVYRVVVTKIGEEKRRIAWVRLGRDVWGNTPEDFKVIWEDEWRPSEPPVG